MIATAAVVGAMLALVYPSLQYALGPALVLSGIVRLDADSLTTHFYLGTWTLISQVGAALLHAGTPQRAMHYTYGMVCWSLLLSAHAMLVYGITRNSIISLAGAIVCFVAGKPTYFFESPDYPALSATFGRVHEHAYGAIAAALSAFVLGSIASRRTFAAGLSAGLLLSVHPVIGLYTIGVVGIALVLTRTTADFPIRALAIPFLIGATISVVSFAAFLHYRPAPWPTDASYLATYFKFWDAHRNVTMSFERAARVLAGCLVIATAATGCLIAKIKGAGRVAIIAVLISTAAAALAYFSVHLMPWLYPSITFNAVPGRFLNFQAYIAAPLLFATLYVAMARLSQNRLLATSICGALLAITAHISIPKPRELWYPIRAFVRAPFPEIGSDAAFWAKVRNLNFRGNVLAAHQAATPALIRGHLRLAFDVRNFDYVPYLPYTARMTAKFIERGYGVPFASPPFNVRYKGQLLRESGREYWESLSRSGWTDIRRDLSVQGLLAPSEWDIDLPVLIRGDIFTLYQTGS